MINSLRTEFRKLTTVKSTYFIVGFGCLLAMFFSFYVFGVKFDSLGASDPNKYQDTVFLMLSNTMFLAGIVGLLLFTHEYRYNMITYTLTSVKNRINVLLAKSLVMIGFGAIFAVLIGILTIVSLHLGLQVSNTDLVNQNLDIDQLVWRGLFAMVGASMFGLLLGGLVRNQIGAIVALLVGPGAIEGLLSLLLKSKAVYLPFTALGQMIQGSGGAEVFNGAKALTPARSALVVCIYIVVFWLITLWLLGRRDAN